jgi:hypothetical protein
VVSRGGALAGVSTRCPLDKHIAAYEGVHRERAVAVNAEAAGLHQFTRGEDPGESRTEGGGPNVVVAATVADPEVSRGDEVAPTLAALTRGLDNCTPFDRRPAQVIVRDHAEIVNQCADRKRSIGGGPARRERETTVVTRARQKSAA